MIVLDDYAGEKHLVQEFIEYTLKKPIEICNRPVNFFIWGYEIWLPEGGRYSGPGRLDLLATDDNGRVWLIEAKHSLNPELGAAVWNSQILNYRKTLSQLKSNQIVLWSCRYLTGKCFGSKRPRIISQSCDSLLKAFEEWLKYLGRENFREEAYHLYNKSLNDLKNEDVVSAVLSDVYKDEVWKERPADGKDYAYFISSGRGDNVKIRVLLDSNNKTKGELSENIIPKTWAELMKDKRSEMPTPVSVRNVLSNDAVELYDYLLECIKNLGWDGTYRYNSKSYVILLPSIYGPCIGIQIGLVDYDAKSHSMMTKLPGQAGFKCDIDLSEFKRHKEFNRIGLEIAEKLVLNAGYVGKGAGKAVGQRRLSKSEREKWSWILNHRPNDSNCRDFTGRDGDLEHIKNMLSIIEQYVTTGEGVQREG